MSKFSESFSEWFNYLTTKEKNASQTLIIEELIRKLNANEKMVDTDK
jgi:hypothetical protein